MKNTEKPAHVALDAEIVRFKADGAPVWQPIIIERWDDGRSAFTRPAIYCASWHGAINEAHEYLAKPRDTF
ncbi:hypothetical protein [Asticcacaulis sp.]|uniref:hypothetical protein n=1 Tax=Asticcacaulis sp. TaxID=1872648 RepID=UPI002B71C622|nr:hypothetical protein [Asticcacaulis sp.]HTM83282.1 hypothetical protein [Asticcacaulis sp.]